MQTFEGADFEYAAHIAEREEDALLIRTSGWGKYFLDVDNINVNLPKFDA
jgi:hypothetical protein